MHSCGAACNAALRHQTSIHTIWRYSKTQAFPRAHLYVCTHIHMHLCCVGKRPFGVSILYMGWDPHFGFQLYQSDPSGNYGGWKATCIGSNHQAAISLLKQDYKESPSLNDALQLAIKVLNKTLDSTKLNAEKGNFTWYYHYFDTLHDIVLLALALSGCLCCCVITCS